MFGEKMIFAGVVDPNVTDPLSKAVGDYDRVHESVSRSSTFINGRWIEQNQPSWSVQRQRILDPADISNPPAGTAFVFHGAQPELIRLSMIHSDPLWQRMKEPPEQTDEPAKTDSSVGVLRALAIARVIPWPTVRRSVIVLLSMAGPSGRVASGLLSQVDKKVKKKG